MNHQEFKARFLPCHKKMYYMAFRYLGNECDAEDMVQEAYLKLWEKRETLIEIANNEAYAVTVVKNLCLDRLRSPQIETDSPETLTHEPEPAPPPDTLYEAREEVRHLLKIIGTLPEQQRQVILLKHFEEKSVDEIEQETGLSNTHIRVLLSRARTRIKELFNQRL